MKPQFAVAGLLLAISILPSARGASAWVTYEPAAGSANGKQIVLLSGDEEYRSEEGLPQLGKILARHHGFKCTVLFSQDDDTTIDPNNQTHVPGMDLLDSADLVIDQFRFRELPDPDMKHFVDYLNAGKPMIVLRTGTHSFAYSRNKQSPYAKYSWDYKGEGWQGGFGGKIVGETWTYHHGNHGVEGSRGLIDGRNQKDPILRSVANLFGPTDVYGVNPDFPADASILVWGVTLTGLGPYDPPNWTKPVMPIVWTRKYTAESGKTGRVLCSTIGAAIDFAQEDLRRLVVNACYDFTGLEVPEKADVTIVGAYQPTLFGFNKFTRGVKVSAHELKAGSKKETPAP